LRRRYRPHPAVRLAVAIHEEAWIVRIRGGLHPRLEILRRDVKEVGVHRAGEEKQLVHKLRPQRRPVLLEVVAQVVILLPVLRDLLVHYAGLLVEERLEEAVGTERPEDGGPDVDLLARATMSAGDQLVTVALF